MGLFCVYMYMYVCNYLKKIYDLSLEAVRVFVCMHVDVCELGTLGWLASHKRSLTHRPSSQGWASRCP